MTDEKKAPAPSGLWGWVASATEVVKKQSDVIYNIYKEDLKEFSQTVIKDTTAVVQEQISTLSGASTEQKSKPKLGSGGTRHQNKLAALQRDESTYTTPVLTENTEASERTYYEEWLKSFDLTKETEAITHLLTTDTQVREIHGRLVPAVVSYRDFWERYSYRHHKLLAEEQRRAALLLQASGNDEEEIGWDVEDDAKQSESPKVAVASTTPSDEPKPTTDVTTTTTSSEQPTDTTQTPSPTTKQPTAPTQSIEPPHTKSKEPIEEPSPAALSAPLVTAKTSSPSVPKEPTTPPPTPVADAVVFEEVPATPEKSETRKPAATPIATPVATPVKSNDTAAPVSPTPNPASSQASKAKPTSPPAEEDDLDAEIAAKTKEMTTKDSSDLDDESGWDKWE